MQTEHKNRGGLGTRLAIHHVTYHKMKRKADDCSNMTFLFVSLAFLSGGLQDGWKGGVDLLFC